MNLESDHLGEEDGAGANLPRPQALIVEDNILIAMEIEDILRDLGYDPCHLVGTVEAALQIIDQHEIAFALLDVGLGAETSEPVALVLQAKGTPFVFATGYGELANLPDCFADVPLVSKPFDTGEIRAALLRLDGN